MRELTVAGTAWGPSFLPFFTLSYNTVFPSASFDEHGLTVRVLRKTKLPWETVENARVRKGIFTTDCVITVGNSRFILSFWEREDLGVLVKELRARGIPTTVPDAIEKDLN